MIQFDVNEVGMTTLNLNMEGQMQKNSTFVPPTKWAWNERYLLLCFWVNFSLNLFSLHKKNSPTLMQLPARKKFQCKSVLLREESVSLVKPIDLIDKLGESVLMLCLPENMEMFKDAVSILLSFFDCKKIKQPQEQSCMIQVLLIPDKAVRCFLMYPS